MPLPSEALCLTSYQLLRAETGLQKKGSGTLQGFVNQQSPNKGCHSEYTTRWHSCHRQKLGMLALLHKDLCCHTTKRTPLVGGQDPANALTRQVSF